MPMTTKEPLEVYHAAEKNESDDLVKLMLCGGIGAGKTTILKALAENFVQSGRGPMFLYLFDPNARRSIRNDPNISYFECLPDQLDLGIRTLSGKKKDDTSSARFAQEPLTYPRFEEHFERALEEDFFDQFGAVGIDSCTTFGDCIMDRVQFLNGRLGKHPEQADYTAQMHTFATVWRKLVAKDKHIIATAHEDAYQVLDGGLRPKPGQEGAANRIEYQLVMTGRLRLRIPLLFSDIYRCYADKRGGRASYYVDTVGDTQRKYLRCSIPNAPAEIDVSVDDWSPSGLAANQINKLLAGELSEE